MGRHVSALIQISCGHIFSGLPVSFLVFFTVGSNLVLHVSANRVLHVPLFCTMKTTRWTIGATSFILRHRLVKINHAHKGICTGPNCLCVLQAKLPWKTTK
ncbi:hypothetical protein SORBI_3004G061100 [Sorghum bicolor]|uniref:Uncharacterized protein n=1 Tax=Sorghum bicolor TaxID=4558 RepID=A0A194YMZ9_SORBI|nr:hypothetical protein SORBI_3004G061100 [Sorghum bicolor]